MTESLPTNVTQTARLTLEMRRDNDHLFRWYEMGTDNRADVCAAADTPTEAWSNACAVWRGAAWNLRRLSSTVCEIDKDDPLLPVEVAKERLEAAASNHGEEVHARYAGSCWRDRNDAVIAIQNHADPDDVVLRMWGE